MITYFALTIINIFPNHGVWLFFFTTIFGETFLKLWFWRYFRFLSLWLRYCWRFCLNCDKNILRSWADSITTPPGYGLTQLLSKSQAPECLRGSCPVVLRIVISVKSRSCLKVVFNYDFSIWFLFNGAWRHKRMSLDIFNLITDFLFYFIYR